MNRVAITGWLQFDNELRKVGNDISMINNVVSVKDKFKGADGKYKYHNIRIKAYRSTADFINRYVHKGDKILVEGSLEVYRPEQGREIVSVVVSDVELLDAKRTETKKLVKADPMFDGFEEVEEDDPF